MITELPSGDLLVSGAIEAHEGARAAVLDVPDLFRLDVLALRDSLRIVVRNRTDLPLRFEPDGYPRPVIHQGDVAELPARPGHHEATVTFGDVLEARVVIATLRDGERGTVQITGQAVVAHA